MQAFSNFFLNLIKENCFVEFYKYNNKSIIHVYNNLLRDAHLSHWWATVILQSKSDLQLEVDILKKFNPFHFVTYIQNIIHLTSEHNYFAESHSENNQVKNLLNSDLNNFLNTTLPNLISLIVMGHLLYNLILHHHCHVYLRNLFIMIIILKNFTTID